MSLVFREVTALSFIELLAQQQGCSHLKALATLLSNVLSHIPDFSLGTSCTPEYIEATIIQYLGSLPDEFHRDYFPKSQIRIKKLRKIESFLHSLPVVENNLTGCLHEHYSPLPDAPNATILHNLHSLWKKILEMQVNMENTLFHMLDAHPAHTEENLKSVMKFVRIFRH